MKSGSDTTTGRAADVGTKKKARESSKLFQIHRTDRESGGLGKEARQYVKLLARLAGGPMGVEITSNLSADRSGVANSSCEPSVDHSK